MLKSKFEGETRIFRRDLDNGKTIYSTTLSQKNIKGEWEQVFIDIKFKKDVDIQDRQDIIINNGWLTFYKKENGLVKFSIFVNDFIEKEKDFVSDGDLPF